MLFAVFAVNNGT